MTAIDYQADTMQLLQRFDKTDISLWKKVLEALVAIYRDEESARVKKLAKQNVKTSFEASSEHEIPDVILSLLGAAEPIDDDDLNGRKAYYQYLEEKYQ